MSNEEEVKEKKREPARASRSALKAAEEIADWCEKRKLAVLADAKWQMRTVWFLLGGGVVLLLILPRVVALIDYAAATLPPDAVKEASEALSQMVVNRTEMQEELQAAETQLANRRIERQKAETDLKIATDKFKKPFEEPLAVWQQIGPKNLNLRINDFLATPDGVQIVAGTEVIDGVEKVVLLHSLDGDPWSIVAPEIEGERVPGIIRALAQAPNGDLVAVGGRHPTGTEWFTQVLHSSDGDTWFLEQPSESGKLIEGNLLDVEPAPSGGLVATGWRDQPGNVQVLILHSPDGKEWSTLRSDAQEVLEAEGALATVTTTPDSGLIAAGRDHIARDILTNILHSKDGTSWSAFHPIENGERILGQIHAVVSTADGALIAAGTEHTPGEKQALLLHSRDGSPWSVHRLQANGEIISGEIHSLVTMSDGELIAAGTGAANFSSAMFLLRSKDGEEWSKIPLELSEVRSALISDLQVHRFNDKLFITGNDVPFMRSAPNMRDLAMKQLLAGETLSNLAVPEGSKERAETVIKNIRDLEIATERVEQQLAFRDQTQASYERQTIAVKRIEKANKDLEQALRRTEPVRQASWIATRLAVIAILIFLVQIVVNRYRYLQRLADFYDGRAQAFRMLAASGPTAAGAILQDVSLNDLMTGLTPSSISFGRAPEPPTQEFLSILQATLKK